MSKILRSVVVLLACAGPGSCSGDGGSGGRDGGSISDGAVPGDAPASADGRATDGPVSEAASGGSAGSCDSPTTREGLPCDCDPAPYCNTHLCAQAEIHSLRCGNGRWYVVVQWDSPCSSPPDGSASADVSASASR